MLAFLLSLVLHVHQGESINAALDSARRVYEAKGERTTIWIEPGTYQEELTIDVPGLKLKGTSKKTPAKISWYYGHGYQYRSMDTINYGGSRSRRWNASVLVTVPDFYAENIIFENSFNLYVSEKEAQDSLYILPEYTAHEMPIRPKEVGSTVVATKAYRERAAAISFTEGAQHAHLKNCQAIGKQDVLYGDQGASIYWEGGILSGGVDFIFGGMTLCVDRATIIANVTDEKNDKCYISAGRSEAGSRGMLFYKCHIQSPVPGKVWLARPWRWWGETVWAYTTWDEGVIVPEAWNTGLVKNKEGFNPENPCPYSYEYKSQDASQNRPAWVTILSKPQLPDGTKLKPKNWLKAKSQ